MKVLPAVKTDRWNFIANWVDGSLYAFALSLASISTVIPLFIRELGGGGTALVLVPALWYLGNNIPQVLVAGIVTAKQDVKAYVLVTAAVQRIPWVIMALVTFLLIPVVPGIVAIIITLIGVLLLAIASSINMPGWFELVSKITPRHYRGRLFAYRALTGAILGVLGGLLVSYVLDFIPFPQNYGTLFLLAFLVTCLSYLALCFLKEPTGGHAGQRATLLESRNKMLSIIRENKNFRNFLIADALMILVLLADGFFAVHAVEKFQLSAGYGGRFTIVMMLSMVLGNLFYGHIADNQGHRINITLGAFTAASASLTAILAPSIILYYLVFVFTAATAGLLHTSRLAFIAELANEMDRALYVALANLMTVPIALLGIGGGWVTRHYGYEGLFAITGLTALLIAAWMILKVKEPRLGISTLD
ncbi:MAG: MFS transporter [Candidatus Marinimicrobia bacterium]|nr:MFS transporter [Candidatus Neomarinimicrobiota bacterium]MCF7850927.1 MFS transporter [Candidatus Neomarinimicrobiota bacterium]